MRGRRIITLGRFAALVVIMGVFSCDGGTPPPDPNRAPAAVGVIPPLTLAVGESETIDVSQYFSDPDGDNLNYSATSTNEGVLTVSVSGSVVTATGVAAGQVNVTITATDPDGLTASHVFDATVQAANRAPVAVGEIPPLTLDEGEEFTATVDQFFSDPDGDALTYAASVSDTAVATASISGNMITVTALAEGMATITVTATDPGGLSAMQSTTLTVNAVNRAPEITDTIPHQELTEGDTLTLDAADHFSDPDGDTLAFTAESDDATVATASVDGSMITVAAVGAGSALVSVTATDPGGLSVTQTFAADVAAANRAPEAVGQIPPLAMTEGEMFTAPVDGFFSDPDGDTLTYAATVSDTTVATASISGTMITVMALAEGMATITVTATDPGGLSATQSTTLTVTALNQAPEAVGQIPPVPLTEGEMFTASVEQFFNDPDGDTLTYAASVSDNTVATASMSGAMITVTALAEGMATLTVTATDPGGLSATQSTTVTVTSANQAPELTDTIPDQPMEPGDTVTLDVSDNFTDPDGDTLTFTAATDDAAVATVSVDGSMVTIAAAGVGTASITVTATDPDGLSAMQTFAAHVSMGNQAPEAVGQIAAQMVTAGESITVDVSGNFSDPDGDYLTHTAASSDENTATVSVSGAVVTVTGVAAGSATVTVTATDPGGLSAIQIFDVTVNAANQAPTLTDTIPDQPMEPGDTVTLDVSDNFTDPDGDTLTFTAQTDDAAVATVSVDGSTVMIAAADVGTASITVTATDPDGLSAMQTFAAHVSMGNQAPTVAEQFPPLPMYEGESLTVPLDPFFTDPDGDTLTYAASVTDSSVATASVAGNMITITALAEGTATLTVTATDPGGLSATQSTTVTVVGANQAPTITDTIPAQNLMPGDTVTLDVSTNFSDPDDDALIFTAETDDAAVATVSVDGSMVTIAAVAVGSASITVTATDPGGLSAMQTFDVTVSAANQTPEISDTIPVYDLLWVPDSADMTMADTITSVVLDMAAYFSDPDGDPLTYTASTTHDTVAMVESVEGSVVTTVAVSSDTSFAHDTTMIMVTATDPDGESVSQEAMVLVAASDYELWDLIVIQDDGRITLGGFIQLAECFAVTNFPYAGTVYTVHWTTWQVKKGSGWVNLPGTYNENSICPYFDLPDEPAGTYRVVGEITTYPLGGDPETESVLSRRRSADYIKTSN